MKVNYSPYILDVILHGKIDSTKHKAKVKDGVLTITLFKEQPGIWGLLVAPEADKNVIKDIKKEST